MATIKNYIKFNYLFFGNPNSSAVQTGMIKGPQGTCPHGAWTVEAGIRQIVDPPWPCHYNCPGKQGYNDCGW